MFSAFLMDLDLSMLYEKKKYVYNETGGYLFLLKKYIYVNHSFIKKK